MAKIKPLPNGKKTLIKKKNTGKTVGIAIGVLIVLAALGFLVKTEILDKNTGGTTDNPVPPTQTSGLAASVGSEKITMQDLDRAYASVPEVYRAQVKKTDILKQLIDEKLLVIDAARKGIKVTDTDVADEIAGLMKASNITDAEFQQALAEQGITKEEFITSFKNRLLIAKLFNVTILSTSLVTEADAQNYYDENEQLFIEPPSVRASHILVETEEEAEDILDQINAGADFTELATENSIDPSALQNGGDLGYFSSGMMVPEFEQAAFSLSVGEYSEPVKTDFGWHIISLVDKKNGRQVSFEEVKDQLIESLKMAKAQEDFASYISELQSKTQVVIYYKDDSSPTQLPPDETPEEAELLPLEEATEDTVDEIQEELQEELQEDLQEDIQEDIQEEILQEETPTEKLPADTFTGCLNAKGAILYGAYWNKDTQDQLSLFGHEKDDLRYVECGVDGDYAAQTTACKNENILGYPTWKINDEFRPGILTKEQLSDLTGC